MLLLAPRLQPLALSTSVPDLARGARPWARSRSATCRRRRSCVGFVLVGAGNGLIDVYLNVAAQRVEVATQRPVLQWLHASYALGGVTGAAIAGAPPDGRTSTSGSGCAYAARRAGLTARVERCARRSQRTRARGHGHRVLDLRPVPRRRRSWVPALVRAVRVPGGGLDGHVVRASTCAISSGRRPGSPAIVFVAFAGAIFLGRMFAGTRPVRPRAAAPRSSIVGDRLGDRRRGGDRSPTTGRSSGSRSCSSGSRSARPRPRRSASPRTSTRIRRTRSPPSRRWATPGSSGARRSWATSPQTVDLRAAMGVIVVATLGIVGAGLLGPPAASAGAPDRYSARFT